MKKQCVVCESVDNLNTSLHIKIEEVEHTIYLCDAHEDTSPKKAREYFQNNQQKLLDFLAQAKALGIEVIEGPSGLAMIKPAVPEAPMPAHRATQVPQKSGPLAPAAPLHIPNVKSVSGMATSTDGQRLPLEAHQAHNIQEMVKKSVRGELVEKPETTHVEMQQATGRGGAPMTIPKKIVGNVGETDIVFSKTSDREIQDRFQQQKARGAEGRVFSQDGYDAAREPRKCVACGGTGVSRVDGGACKKCKGSGGLTAASGPP